MASVAAARNVFVMGSTGYIGSRLVAALLERGHRVRALARPGSEHKLPPGSEIVLGDALSAPSFAHALADSDTFVHVLGVAHPSPAKAEQFRSIDLASVRAALAALPASRINHFVYVSVAQPAPVMKAYVDSRIEAEQLLSESGLRLTVLRPWYVLGPGHWWPVLLLPLYWFAELIPAWRASARRLGLVSIRHILRALVSAIEAPEAAEKIVVHDASRLRTLDPSIHSEGL
jgi:uncharacterized protein YbjT (DUF2867 family)